MIAEMEPTARSRPWWRLFWILMALLVVPLLMSVLWYYNTSDLVAVRELAKRQGVPTSVVEWGRIPSSSESRAQVDRLTVLSKELKDYHSELFRGRIEGGDAKGDRLRPFKPIPEQARRHHAGLDQSIVNEALTILDALPYEPIILSNGDPDNRPKDKIGTVRQLTRWLSERVQLAERDQVVQEVRRLLRVIIVTDVETDIDVIVKSSLIAIAFSVVATRLDDLRENATEITEVLESIDRRLPKDMLQGQTGSFLEILRLFENPSKMVGLTMWAPDQSWLDPYLNPLRVRAGRAATLLRQLERERKLRELGLGTEYHQWSSQVAKELEALREWNLGEWLPKFIGTGNSMMDDFPLEARLRIRLLIAELRQEPWPIDPFDPSQLSLRQLTRDGVVIGAYSLGGDGRDDGGRRPKDNPFLLFGPLDPP